jgi:hypothetical protein
MEVSGQLHAPDFTSVDIAAGMYWIRNYEVIRVALDVMLRRISCPCRKWCLISPQFTTRHVVPELSRLYSAVSS